MARSNAQRKPEEAAANASTRPVLQAGTDAVTSPAADAVEHLDRLIHEKLRLSIVSALAANTSLTFTELKALLGASDGNLSVHARKLEDAGYLSCNKSFEGRVPKTEYKLTAAGRKAFEKYLDHMEALLKAMRPDAAGGGA